MIRNRKDDMLSEATNRFYGAWWGAFLGDAAAMPTHGFSSSKLLKADYGEVKSFTAPKPTHPESVLHAIPAPILPPEYDYIGPNAAISGASATPTRIAEWTPAKTPFLCILHCTWQYRCAKKADSTPTTGWNGTGS